MNNEEQAETLKQVLGLEKTIEKTKGKLNELQAEKFSNEPKSPERKNVNRTYPQITSTINLNYYLLAAFAPFLIVFILTAGFASVDLVIGCLVMIFLMIPISIGWAIFVLAFVYRKQKKENIEEIRNSVEYKKTCANEDKKFDEVQLQYDKEYECEKNEYDTMILPKYKKDLSEWSMNQKKKIDCEKKTLENAQIKLEQLYSSTKIVPIQYRNIPALQYISDMVSSSDYNVMQAIENYDKKTQRDLEEIKIRENQISNQLAQQANQLADEQADLLYQQNEIASKARRDANIASVVNAVQLHGISKKMRK